MTSAYVGVLVAVLIDGVLVPSVPPAALVHGHVAGPAQLIARFADRVETNGSVLVAERDGRRCAQQRAADGSVALAPIVRCFGGDAQWDGHTRTLSIAFARTGIVRTPAPYDPTAPQVAPTTIFTPEPAAPTPRTIDTGAPRPRRTALPAVPSWPLPTRRPRP